MDLSAPPLVPLAALALASSGNVGAPPPDTPVAAAPAPGLHAGTTAQRRPVSIRVLDGGRRAAWRIGYVARCPDGRVVRGRYVSGRGTPLIAIGPDGRFRVSRSEPAEFRPGGTGRARFVLSGRLGRAGGAGTWRLTLVPPPARGGPVECEAGPLRWRVRRG